MTRTILVLVACGLLLAPSLQAAAPAPTPQERLARQTVERFEISTTLKDAIQHYAKLAEVKIEVDWPALRAAGVKEDARVTLKVPLRATVGQVLDLTLAQVAQPGRPLAWCADNDGVWVSSQIDVMYRGQLVRRYAASRPAGPAPTTAAEFDFEKVAVDKVFDFLHNLSGVNFVVNWRSLEQAGIARDTPVSLKARDISIARALDLVLDQLNAGRGRFECVYWVIDEGVVSVATGAALNTELRVRTWDVSDLLLVIPSAQRPALAGAAGPSGPRTDSGNTGRQESDNLFVRPANGGAANRPDDPAALRQAQADNLVGMIKDSIGEDMWQPTGKGNIRILRGQMIITQTPLGFKLLQEAMRIR